MEALKHNWLFKSYFEQRGYWDKLQYEKDLDSKIFMLQKQNKILDDKIREMLELQDKLGLKPVPEDDIKDENPGTK
jgi:phospholipid/cholesterol/gamma-HCH transport system substrate-binding protein